VTTHYVYDEQTVVGETRSDGTSSWYTPGPNGYISRTDLDNQGNVTNKEWFVYDGLGSCRALVKPNAQGTEAVLVAHYDYDVYGSVRTQSGSSSNKFKYVASIGHPTDEETGLIYMRARYYDLQVGRFVSEDPALDGLNWYWYADGNPVSNVDPSGKDALSWTFWALGMLFAGLALGAMIGYWRTVNKSDLPLYLPGAPERMGWLNAAINFSNASVAMFGLAAVGMLTDKILAYIGGGIIAASAIVAVLVKATESGLKTAAGAAVAAAFTYGLIVLGNVLSIGAELPD